MLVDKLQVFGFSEHEVRVYLALLELRTSVVSEIAKKAQMNRSTAYVTLEGLAKKGLASISEDSDKVRLYNPTEPERLLQMLQEKAYKSTQLVKRAETILPELRSLYESVDSTSSPVKKYDVRYYEGVEGVKTVYEDTLNSTETIRAYASTENMNMAIPNYFPEYYRKRTARNIHVRAIFPDTPEAKERLAHNEREGRTAYLIPREKYDFSPEIDIYDNKVAFMSLREKFGLVIENQEFAAALKKVFELSWTEAGRLHRRFYGKTALLSAIFLVFLFWWASFSLFLWNKSLIQNILWTGSYQLLALFGAIFAFINSRKWGWGKNLMGKVLLIFGLGLLFQVVGQSIFAFYVLILQIEVPYPSFAEIGYFGSMLFYIYGTILLLRVQKLSLTLDNLKKNAVKFFIPIFLMIASYAIFFKDYILDFSDPLKIFFDFSYPIGDVIYLSIATIALTLSWNILGNLMKYRVLGIFIALGLQYIADYNFFYQAANGAWINGAYGDALFMLAYFVMALTLISFHPHYFRKFSQ